MLKYNLYNNNRIYNFTSQKVHKPMLEETQKKTVEHANEKNNHHKLVGEEKDFIKQAANFLEEIAHQQTLKYSAEETEQFVNQFEDLDIDEKYTCAQVLLSQAWSAVQSRMYTKAQKQIFLIIPLCNKYKIDFPDFEIDKLLLECWINNQDLMYDERKNNTQLLQQCGFKFGKLQRRRIKKKKNNWFYQYLLKKICCCSI